MLLVLARLTTLQSLHVKKVHTFTMCEKVQVYTFCKVCTFDNMKKFVFACLHVYNVTRACTFDNFTKFAREKSSSS